MKINFKLSAKRNQEGMGQIILCSALFVDSKSVHISAKSEVYTLPKFFSEEKGIDFGKAKSIKPDVRNFHNEQKEKLDGILQAISKESGETDKALMVGGWLQDVVDRKNHPERFISKEEQEKQKTIWEKAKDYMEAQNVCEGRKRAYKVAIRCMYRYEHYLNEIKGEPFSWDNVCDISEDNIQDFRNYLENESDLNDTKKERDFFQRIVLEYPEGFQGGNHISERGQHSVDLKLKQIKSFFKRLFDKSLIAKNPFEGFSIKSYDYAQPYLLEKEERDKLASTPMPSESLEHVRDIFIFQCYCGARVSDLQKLTSKNLNGNVLTYIPQKTAKESDQVATIELTDYPMKLIKKYDGVDKQGRLFPFISDQKYNKYIKEIFTIAGLTRGVSVKDTRSGKPTTRPLNELASSHLARRTFVGLMYANNIPLEVIGTMSGHAKNSKEISRYYKVTDKQRSEAAKSLASKESKVKALAEQLASLNLDPDKQAAIMAIINQ